jgi:hypothetical protein
LKDAVELIFIEVDAVEATPSANVIKFLKVFVDRALAVWREMKNSEEFR